MSVTKIKVSPDLQLYRKAWRLYHAGIIDKEELINLLDKVNCEK